MRFFYDCEFIEDGTTIDLVSIGVVGEDGREFYAVSTEFDPSRAGAWVRANVLPKLPSPADQAWRSRQRLRADLLEFLTSAPGEVELWAWIAAYDHVALCQLWGAMPALPRALPRFTRELRQRWEDAGTPAAPAAHRRRPRRAGRRPAEPAAVGGDRGGGRRSLTVSERHRTDSVLPGSGEDADAAGADEQADDDEHDAPESWRRMIAKMPATTRITARIHRRVAMTR